MTKLPDKAHKETYVRNMFNSIAGKYDLMNTLMSIGQDKAWRKFTVARAEAKPGDNALDVCCGTCMLTMELANTIAPDGTVTGLDFSENMLKVGQENIGDFKHKDLIKLVQGNAMALPFEDNSFDCVTVGWGLRNVPEIETAIKEMLRVVKPGGKVVSLDMGKPTAPVFKQAHWFYFEQIVPLMGKFWAGKKGAYSYLHDSTREFPAQDELTKIFARCGLTETRYHNLTGGVVAVVEGRKG